MGDNSAIEWTDATWNPVRGCTKVSPGCKRCYAERFAERFRGVPGHAFEQGFDLKLVPEMLDAPLRWKRPRLVFVNSMSDLFHAAIPKEYIAAVFGVMAASPQHTFQVLTKRAAGMRSWFEWMAQADQVGDGIHAAVTEMFGIPELNRAMLGDKALTDDESTKWDHLIEDAPDWPLSNVWLGTSVEEQQRAEERIPHLLECPAAVRFLSAEPLLGPLNLSPWLSGSRTFHVSLSVEGALRNRSYDGLVGDDGNPLSRAKAEQELRAASLNGVKLIKASECDDFDPDKGCRGHRNPRLDWVIVGGESGPGAREIDLDWVRDIRDQCRDAGVALFVKQLGTRWARANGADTKGTSFALWPEDLRIQEMPPRAGEGAP